MHPSSLLQRGAVIMDAKVIGGVGFGALLSLMLGFFIIPTEQTIERATLIAADSSAIYPHLVDLAAWDDWEPWETDVVGSPTVGAGARRGWPDGAVLRVEEAERDIAVRYILEQSPQPASGAIELKTHKDGTVVVWTHHTQTGYSPGARLAGWTARAKLALEIDDALAGLKATAEPPPR